jgi:hypothetical protein
MGQNFYRIGPKILMSRDQKNRLKIKQYLLIFYFFFSNEMGGGAMAPTGHPQLRPDTNL